MSLTELTNLQAELQIINEYLTLCDELNLEYGSYVQALIERKTEILKQFTH
jgi:hypothetical protein